MRQRGTALLALCLASTLSALQIPSTSAQDSQSANFWIEVCQEDHAANLLCIGYLRGMYDMNEMMTFLHKRPIWCLPTGATLPQMRMVIMADLQSRPAELHLPFAGLATIALRKAFPCPGEPLLKGKK